MDKQIISTTKAPAAIGPYAQAIKVGDFIFTSGQIPLVPETMEIVTGDVKAQTIQVLENLKAVLEAANSSLEKIVKATVFIKDMNDFGAINEIYGQYLGANPPARSCVEVARLPKDVLVEIEVVALG